MLSDIVDAAVKRYAKPQWMPPTLSEDDLKQEAWVAVLEAQGCGIDDPSELRRQAELRIKAVMRAELNRLDVPHPDPLSLPNARPIGSTAAGPRPEGRHGRPGRQP